MIALRGKSKIGHRVELRAGAQELWFGRPEEVGDVNGDGRAEVLVHGTQAADDVVVRLYLGASDGVDPRPRQNGRRRAT